MRKKVQNLRPPFWLFQRTLNELLQCFSLLNRRSDHAVWRMSNKNILGRAWLLLHQRLTIFLGSNLSIFDQHENACAQCLFQVKCH